MSKLINYSLLWDKICEYATKAGRGTARPMLQLFFVLKSNDTPKSDKILIYSSIAYLVLPIDLISAKRLPIIGWLDEVVALTVAYQKMKRYITPEIERKVEDILDNLIPNTTAYEIIE